MKLAIYSDFTGELLTVYDVTNPRVTTNRLVSDEGEFDGIGSNFILLDAEVEAPASLAEATPLDKKYNLEDEKQQKIDELSALCEVKIMEGFFCEETGYYYRLNDKDQDNFSQRLSTILVVGKENYTKPLYWRTGLEGDGVYVLHTVDEFLAVISSADDHKTYCTMRYSQLKEKVKMCETMPEVSAINWDTEI